MVFEATVKIKQYCSVCKEELTMEVVPTADGEEDGVLWLRCPRCQGFLPKISSSLAQPATRDDESAAPADSSLARAEADGGEETRASTGGERVESLETDDGPNDTTKELESATAVQEEPIADYAAKLADADLTRAVPYRPWGTYGIGAVIHHLAWDDCGVVVDKEILPGNRHVVKVFFEKAGVVRLIEEDTRTA